MALLRQSLRIAFRQAAVFRAPLAIQAPRSFGAVATFKAPHLQRIDGDFPVLVNGGRPFKGASASEPEMDYVEEPSMMYMFGIMAVPLIFQFWILTNYC